MNKLAIGINRRLLLKLLSFGVALPFCWQTRNRSASSNIDFSGHLSESQSLIHEGHTRSYRIYSPNSLPTTPSPAILLLHGHGGSVRQLIGLDGRKAPFKLWMPIADRENLTLIVPNGLISPDGKRGWNDARNIATNPDSNDVDFLCTLLETVAMSYPIDVNRVYVTGISNGGHMALRLAAEVPNKLAAVAAIAAANPDPTFAHQSPHPISVMLMNGTDDRFVPYDGGNVIDDRGAVQSTQDSIQYWVTHNQCEETNTSVRYANRSSTDGCTASRSTYRNSGANIEVVLIRILGGGHTEPSMLQPYSRLWLAIVGAQNQDIEMADEVWNFFQRKTSAHPLL